MTVCPRYCARPVKNWFQSKGLAITTAGRAAGAACNTKAIAERPLAGGIAPYPWMVQRASKMYVGPLTNSDISRAAQMCVDINCMGGGVFGFTACLTCKPCYQTYGGCSHACLCPHTPLHCHTWDPLHHPQVHQQIVPKQRVLLP